MTILKNGSTLLVEILTEDSFSVVLAMTDTAFATWRKDDKGDTFWGDYFPQTLDGLQEAIIDLVARTGK